MIRVGVGVDDFVDRLTEQGVITARAAIESVLEDLVIDAQASWPVRTGVSRAAFSVEMAGSVGRIAGEIVNNSGYAPYINRGRSLHNLLVLPFKAETLLLPGEIERKLSEIK